MGGPRLVHQSTIHLLHRRLFWTLYPRIVSIDFLHGKFHVCKTAALLFRLEEENKEVTYSLFSVSRCIVKRKVRLRGRDSVSLSLASELYFLPPSRLMAWRFVMYSRSPSQGRTVLGSSAKWAAERWD